MPPDASRLPIVSGDEVVHLCIDMQRLFDETEWRTPWMRRVLPQIVALCEARPNHTIFTRFVPPTSPDDTTGAWCDYYRRWPQFTQAKLEPGLIDLLPELTTFTPPARILDKAVYSPWFDGRLHADLSSRGVTTLVISGAETDVCVLAAVLGAIDHGYRVALATDAVCGSSDAMHDRIIDLYHCRFSQQVVAAETDEILDAWR